MKLSQTREAIVEEFEKIFSPGDNFGLGLNNVRPNGSVKELKDHLTQALKDYTQSIVRMVEGMGEDVVAPDREPPYRVDYVNKSKLLQELNK